MNNIEIAAAFDSNYIVPVTVMLKSLFDNNKNIVITVNLLYLVTQTKSEDVNWLENYIVSEGHLCRHIPVTNEKLGEVPDSRHGRSSFLRLLLPGLLPKEIKKILYLDCDLVVAGSILELYNMNIDSFYLAAARDSTSIQSPEHTKNLNLPEKYFYFNSGVLLLNLEKLRKEKLQKFFLKNLKNINNVIKAYDQDVLNVTLCSKVKYMPPRYNMNFFIERDIKAQIWTKEEIEDVKKHPVIIHYIGLVKPWHYISFHPKTGLWWRYLRLTPFAGTFVPKGRTFENFFKKYYLLLFRRFDLLLSMKQKRAIGKLMPDFIKKPFKKSLLKSV